MRHPPRQQRQQHHRAYHVGVGERGGAAERAGDHIDERRPSGTLQFVDATKPDVSLPLEKARALEHQTTKKGLLVRTAKSRTPARIALDPDRVQDTLGWILLLLLPSPPHPTPLHRREDGRDPGQ